MINVMVLDDSEDIISGYLTILPFIIKNHPTIISAEDGIEALKQLENSPKKIDLIFSDISMPNMDGIEFLNELRTNPKYILHKNAIVIMATAHGEKDTVIKAKKGGANGYILKPFDIGSLIKALSPHVKRLGIKIFEEKR